MPNSNNKKKNPFSELTPEIEALSRLVIANDNIDPELYSRYDVKRGLRDANGKGVLTGLTEIAEVKSYTIDDNEMIACPGQLFYRGYEINDLVNGFLSEKRQGFEETTFLLMFGKLPNEEELKNFQALLQKRRTLPPNFVRDVIMKAPSKDMMNSLLRSILTLYSYDDYPDDTKLSNVLRQCINLIAVTPLLVAYSYRAYKHYREGDSLFILQPKEGLSTAETLFCTLREDSHYTELEAKVLDLCLCLHADHGGGNNSAFTTRVVTSTGTDTYSAIAAALASLKGPRHGGANIKVNAMMNYLEERVGDWKDDEEIDRHLTNILRARSFDKKGLIYGLGHAVYTLSDPRCELLREFAGALAAEKGYEEEFDFYRKVEERGRQVIMSRKKSLRESICANVDFYSGFVYKILGIPQELFTPVFAVARMSGWSAHRLEELATGSKIIRPAYKNVVRHAKYVPIEDR